MKKEKLKCKDCHYSAQIETEYGDIRKCLHYNRLLKIKHMEKKKPKKCDGYCSKHSLTAVRDRMEQAVKYPESTSIM